jgi:molecular chaperone DnaK (HSP70)
MMFAFLTTLSFSSIYGIDLGSQNIRMAVSSPEKQIEIKLGVRDQRFTPNY